MTRGVAEGADLLDAFRNALAMLEQSADAINALNVFPVPDGDTGSNMLSTLRAAIAEGESLPAEERTAGAVAAAVGHGALMGARGNSGVILSQILLGMAHALEGRQRMSPLDLAHALAVGSQTAHRAVLKPVEGTILTVVREAAAAAVAAAEHDPEMEAVLGAAVEAAEASVAKSPSLLPVLREAGVVDAGGEGLYRILLGALRGSLGRRAPAGAGPGVPVRAAAVIAGGDDGFGYETMFLVNSPPGRALDLEAMRERLLALGESVLVAGDSRAVKVHVHNERPDLVLAYGLSLGPISHVSVENLDQQAREAREARARAFTGPGVAASSAGEANRALLAEPPSAAECGGAGDGGRYLDDVPDTCSTWREDGPGAAGALSAALVPADGVRGAGAGAADGSGPPVWRADRSALAADAGAFAGRSGTATASGVRVPGTGPGEGEAERHASAPALERAAGADLNRLPHAGPPVVAVAAGEGVVAILRSFGVAQIVGGGQAANPSAGELLRAAQGLGVDEVLVLPNNPNVKLAAHQAAALARGTRIVVVPTRNAPEGFAALLAYDPGMDAEANAAAMLTAARRIQTLQVTDAVRDAKIGGRRVRKGQAIVLDPDDGLVAVDADPSAAVLAGVATLRPGYELVTVYYGDGADLEEAESLVTALQRALPGVEVELVHGGQPHYRYILAAE